MLFRTFTHTVCLTTSHSFKWPGSRHNGVSWHQNDKPSWILLQREMMQGAGVTTRILQDVQSSSQIIATNISTLSFYGLDVHLVAHLTLSNH